MTQHHEAASAGYLRARWVWCRRLLALAALIAVVWTFRCPLFFQNFGVVEPGAVYRCAQPKGNLVRLIHDHRLASVLNLRGGTEADPWYEAEVRQTREQQVDFYDFPISAIRRPSRWELLALVDLIERCRYPLLIHCKWGSDRTGLVCSLFLMVKRGEPPSQALRAFSVRHGHFPVGGPKHLEEPLFEYGVWLKAHRLAHTPTRFREWIEHEYQADDPPISLPPLRPGPRPRVSTKPMTARR